MMLIEILKYTILGIVQGFTEPLPISSSGHVFILRKLLNESALSDLNFEIIVNFGSLLAILIIYRKDLIKLIKNFFSFLFKNDNSIEEKRDFRYCLLVVLGVIPVGMVGLFFKDKIETVLQTTKVVGISFIITSIFLFLVRKIKGIKEDKDITWKDALIIGLIQVIALLPGISRSGSTLIGALARDVKREPAVKYSFMLYIPISLGTIILGFRDILKMQNLSEIFLPYLCGFIASFVVSYFTLKWFIKRVQKGNLLYFSIYCLILGILVLIFL